MLTTNKEDQLKEMPSIQTRITRSKDGKYLLHKTTITDVKPVGYYETIMASES